MDVVTFETAVKLKEAGFPQPEVKPGQFWWFVRFPDGSGKKEVLCVVTEVYSAGVKQPGFKFVPIEGGEFEGRIECYAPTATDILRELDYFFEIGIGDDGLWWATGFLGTLSEVNHIEPNPAEACADAWLELNKQTND